MIKFSIIILNYNYAEFLEAAIDSSVGQSYSNCEVIVVDDGSSDNSRAVIATYGDRVVPLFQENQGMVGASNAGFAVSSGEIVMFLDADDLLHSDAAAKVVEKWNPSAAMVHWRLRNIDRDGNEIGLTPSNRYSLAEGDLKEEFLLNYTYVTSPTSGNAYSRAVLEKFFPLPTINLKGEEGYRRKIPTDAYLKGLIPFEGGVVAIEKPLGDYRIHGANNGAKTCGLSNSSKRKRLLWLMNRDLPIHYDWATRTGVDWSPRNMVQDFYRCRVWIYANRLGEGNIGELTFNVKQLFYYLFQGFRFNLRYGWVRAVWLALTNVIIFTVPRGVLNHVIDGILEVEEYAKKRHG